MHVAKEVQASTPKTSSASPVASRRDLKVQLRQMTFSEGEAAVSPAGDGAGDGDGKKKTTDPVDKINAYQAHIDAAAKEWGVSAASIKAQIYVESKGDVNAGSGKSYRGLMQVGSKAWTTVAGKKGWDWDWESDWDDPYRNIMIGVGYRLATEEELTSALAGSDLTVASDEQQLVTKMCYNAGASTIATAMKNAKSTKVADFSKTEHLKPAVIAFDIQRGYRNITLAKWLIANAKTHGITETKVEDVVTNHTTKLTETWFATQGQSAVYDSADVSAIASKLSEITNYGPRIADALEKFPEATTEEVAEPVEVVSAPTLTEHLQAGGVLWRNDGFPDAERPELSGAVREAQARLRALGFRVIADGEFSDRTQRVVEEAQVRYGLTQSGWIDEAMWMVLQRPDAELQALAAEVQANRVADYQALLSALATGTLQPGDGGDASPELQPAVRALQRRVADLGMPVRVDGRFDGRFTNRFRQIQVAVGVEPTGICDQATWDALVRGVVPISGTTE